MKRKNQFVAAALAAALIAAAGSAAAFGGRGAGMMGAECGGPRMLGAVYRLDDLTPEQKKQLDGLRNESRKLMDKARDDRRALHDALQDGADAEKIRPLAEKQGQAVTAMILRQVETRATLEKILTKAQRDKLGDLSCAGGRGGHRHGGPGFGPGL